MKDVLSLTYEIIEGNGYVLIPDGIVEDFTEENGAPVFAPGSQRVFEKF
ncbi:MAG: phytanoyl-CoA dioxygenase family protein [Dolichospermum sp. LBC05a]|nr:hypothetical protein [Dolichospermum sp. WA123]MBS9395551.1 hypothetical protein [Dolichospermum sp. OL01]MCO5799177.1 hypothetical protein [Dolichospermum sp. OL03]MCS6281960.1 hypothetical protein [Dolichospermum sp.]QSV60550.1 MAG: phytanoyl-CoA dioxygenase family protein [Dolichospermum sp. LBC05a]